jgi:putative effector of murein hydrolase LrgA (UPF0299 family)
VLKLTGTINWSWWWVLSPTWISTVIALIFIGIYYLIVRKGYKEEKKREQPQPSKWQQRLREIQEQQKKK